MFTGKKERHSTRKPQTRQIRGRNGRYKPLKNNYLLKKQLLKAMLSNMALALNGLKYPLNNRKGGLTGHYRIT
ncbi:MAG: hypothetical protein ACI89D_002745, partial [Bermanella sp.]